MTRRGTPARSRTSFDALGRPLVIVGAAVFAVAVYWNSIHYGLAQDAFLWIARTRGLFPHTTGIWRTLSYDLFYQVMDAGFGLAGGPYHAVALGLHALNAALVAALGLRLGLSRAAAFAAAILFAAHYASFDVLFAVGSISEPLAAFFVLLSLWLALPSDGRTAGTARAALVTIAFVAALLAKETVVLYPAVLWLALKLHPGGARRALIPCAAAAVIYLVVFWVTDPVGSLRAAPGANPYETRWGSSLLTAWATYLSWAGHLVNIIEADLHDRIASHPEAWLATVAWVAALGWFALQARRGRRSDALPAAAVGSALYAACIAPVLPLATHAFHLYLYLPLAGLGWMLGAAWDAWVPVKLRGIAWLVAVALAIQGFITIRGMEAAPLRETHLPFMGSVRRALLADRVLQKLADVSAPLPDSLCMLGPDALSPPTRPDTTALGAFLFNDVAGALDQGTGIRLHFPQVREVEFFGDLGPWLRQPDVAVFDYQGNVTRGPAAWLYLRRAGIEWASGRIPTTALAVAAADTMTRRWLAGVGGTWREEGRRGIQQQATAMLEAEQRRAMDPRDPRTAVRPGYLAALARIADAATR